ncbi:hypothetical protein LPB03_15390 [Polaribacter vadi]|uniref:POTRA domain-containing protein n=1 Tax=Polaribacter vadi TaxID=1774273 RepID=A0A1B8TQE3_9FLAO|nr:hypothetical protein LPB03_15390 [Polaribacter vadi]OBY61886.1 hypothetical protein LPB3_13915 [Polaribacter vadi]
MKQNIFIKPLILLLFFSIESLYTQRINLKISSVNKNEVTILNKIKYQKKHIDSTSINFEINKISKYLKNIGYFTNTIDSLVKTKNNYSAYFSLNEKINQSEIYVKLKDQYLFNGFEFTNNTINISIEKLQSTLLNISKNIDLEGKSFSKIQLKNIKIKDKKLFAELSIETSSKRIINKVVVKGYDDFPKSFLKNHFNIRANSVFNEKKIKSISEISKNLQFVSEIKTPEVLFTKDSTFLYVYLKKRKNNSFDGLINFATKENGDLLLNGNIDLELNNILNTGEKFKLFWNKIADERQEFEIALKTPYIFKSKITPELSFSIYKQDSTFLNTKFDSKIFYNLNTKIKFALTYNSESSINLDKRIENNIENFSNYFLGFQFDFVVQKNDFFFNDKILLKINPSFGERNLNSSSTNQIKIETTASYIWELNSRNSFYIKNTNGFLKSNTYLNNELFRIGGPKSIRGFNEQSIFVNKYIMFNLEYRFLTSEKSYLYTITDFAKTATLENTKNLNSLGLGFLFINKNSLINISSSIGRNESEKFDFKNAKLLVSWKKSF